MIQEINDKGECFASKKNNFVKKDVSAVYLKHLNCIITANLNLIDPRFSSSFRKDREQCGGGS